VSISEASSSADSSAAIYKRTTHRKVAGPFLHTATLHCENKLERIYKI